MADKYKSKSDAKTWLTRYDMALADQTKMFKRFANWYDSLYAIVGVTPSPWRSKMYIPVLARQTWALIAKFLALKPGFEVRVNSTDQGEGDVDQKAEKAKRKLEYDYENPYMDETMRDKLFAPLLDAVVTGTGLAKVPWTTDEVERYERLPSKDGTVDLSKEKKTTKKVAYNDLIPVNIFNVYVSKSAKNLYKAPWIIIKEYKTLDELKASGLYKNLDQLSGSASEDDTNSYNYSRNRLINGQDKLDSTVDMVKIFECYEGTDICTYAETQSESTETNWLLIREQKNPYWHGKYPLVKFQIKAKPFQFWGEGLFETTYRLQAGYNDVFNHYMDQWNLAENSMLITPERANVNDYVVEPGGVITYRGDIAPTQFKHSEPNPNSLQTILTLMDQAIEGVTISQYAAGNPNSATDQTKGTATGILHLQQAAGDIVSFMRTNFTQSITQVGRMWLSNNQQYMQDELKLTVTNKGQKLPMTITPQDMQGDMELIVDDSTMDPANQDERTTRFMAYMQQLEQIQAASMNQSMQTRWAVKPLYIDYGGLVQDLSEIMGHPNYESLLLNGQIVDQAVQNQQTPMIMPNERFTIDLNQLYGSEASQWLQRNGIQPDPNRQQQAPAAGDAHQTNQTGAGGADPTMITPDHLLQADQQDHQQQMDVAKLALEAQNQHHQQTQDVANIAAQGAQAQAQGPEQPQGNPADQQVFNMAHQLASGGHIDPAILQHLPQPKHKKTGAGKR